MHFPKVCLLLSAATLFALASFGQQTAVKLAPLRLLSLDPKVAIEQKLSGKLTFNAEILYQRTSFGRGVWNQDFTFTDEFGVPTVVRLPGGVSNRWVIAPDLRIYTGKQALKGFYLALGPRFSFNNVSADVRYQEGSKAPSFAESSLKVNMAGGTFAMGVQWLIKEKFVIDWTFFGLGLVGGRMTAEAASSTFTPEDFEDFQFELQELQARGAFKRLEFSSQGQTGTLTGPVLLPAFRSTLAIGWAF